MFYSTSHESLSSQESPVRLLASSTVSGQALVSAPFAEASRIETFSFREGERIVAENQALRGVYFLKSGVVKTFFSRGSHRGRMSSPEFVTRLYGAGEFFLLGSSLLRKAAPQTALAVKPCEVLVYPTREVEEILKGPESLLKSVLLQVSKDQELQASLAKDQYLASVQEKIAHQLVLLAQKFGTPRSGNGITLNLKLTRNELAQLAGTINESLSRHLTELKSEGLIDLTGKEIHILDLESLKKRSGNFV
ncbi:MAG: Crp/Fnr family transcriptional regulator [Bdellovibrio sp.]